MRESVRQMLSAQLRTEEAEREKKRAALQQAFESYERLAEDFNGVQQRIDDLREELGMGLEERSTVTPPELEAAV